MRLSEIATIHSGHLFRKRIEHDNSGKIAVIQARDLQEDNSINWSQLFTVNLNKFRDDCVVRDRDVLFRSRGNYFTATCIESVDRESIASSQFYILRIKSDKALPFYLTWYINSKRAQQYFAQHSAGTGIKHVNKTTLSGLDIPLADLEAQNHIVELNRLQKKEQSLVDLIKDKREKLIEAVLLKKLE